MPIYDFNCAKCQKKFEELVKGDESAVCPTCGGPAEKLPSVPGPAKTGPTPFPYKAGPVHPAASRLGGGCPSGGCGGGKGGFT